MVCELYFNRAVTYTHTMRERDRLREGRMWFLKRSEKVSNRKWYLNKGVKKAREGYCRDTEWKLNDRPKLHHFLFIYNHIIPHPIFLASSGSDCALVSPQLCSMVQQWHLVVAPDKCSAEKIKLHLSIKGVQIKWSGCLWGEDWPSTGMPESSTPIEQ